MDWAPITQDELSAEIATDLENAEPDLRLFWEQIRIAPEKWRLPPWGDAGNGFWVVAVSEARCIWFNDIEGGFDISEFSNRGAIEGYWCSQFSLDQALRALREALATGISPGRFGPPEPLR